MRFIFVLFWIAIAPVLAAAGQLKITDAKAVANLMPPQSKLTITAKVEAPTPCFEAKGTHVGDDKKNPPGYLFEVALLSTQKPDTLCAQVVTQIQLNFVEEPYNGTHDKVIFQDSIGAVTAKIEVVH